MKVSLPAAKRITVGQLLDDLKLDIALRELKSAYKLQSHMRQVREHFGTMRAVAVTGAVVDTYIDKLRTAGKAPATINRYMQVLGAAPRVEGEALNLMRAALADWQGLLRQETGPARMAFQALLAGRLVFTPEERDGVRLCVVGIIGRCTRKATRSHAGPTARSSSGCRMDG